MNNRIAQNFDTIKTVSLFSSLKDDELLKILENAQVISCKKGRRLFSQEQNSLNFYILLEGIIKCFLTDEEGMEAVIQIINAGNSINDIFNDKFQVNIEAVNDSTILSISSQQFKKFIKENANLANNVLLDISLKNKNFIDQLVQLKMANSKQKVGQFLLGMAFEKGSKAKNIELNFDKSVIASYLGIKPETLSRTLKKLKKDGEIAVEKNKITLLRENSLCGFCNSKITIKCHRYNSSFCEQSSFH